MHAKCLRHRFHPKKRRTGSKFGRQQCSSDCQGADNLMSWFSQLWQRATESARRAADDLARAAQTADAKTREAERVAIADAKKIVDNTIAAVREDEAMAAAESDIVVEATRREISQAKKAVGD